MMAREVSWKSSTGAAAPARGYIAGRWRWRWPFAGPAASAATHLPRQRCAPRAASPTSSTPSKSSCQSSGMATTAWSGRPRRGAARVPSAHNPGAPAGAGSRPRARPVPRPASPRGGRCQTCRGLWRPFRPAAGASGDSRGPAPPRTHRPDRPPSPPRRSARREDRGSRRSLCRPPASGPAVAPRRRFASIAGNCVRSHRPGRATPDRGQVFGGEGRRGGTQQMEHDRTVRIEAQGQAQQGRTGQIATVERTAEGSALLLGQPRQSGLPGQTVAGAGADQPAARRSRPGRLHVAHIYDLALEAALALSRRACRADLRPRGRRPGLAIPGRPGADHAAERRLLPGARPGRAGRRVSVKPAART